MKNKLFVFILFLFSFLAWSPNVFATAPSVTPLGDGETDYILPISEPGVYSADLVFNVVLHADSKTAIESALNDAASNGDLGFTWVDDTYSTVTVANIAPVIFDEDVSLIVYEDDGGSQGDPSDGELILIDSSDTEASEIIFAGGYGSEEDPFQIGTCEQLQNINYYASGGYYFSLYQDIDCSETNPEDADFDSEGIWGDEMGFMPIGYTYDYENDIEYGNSFLGIFDGNEYTISGLYINRPNFVSVGLFGEVGDYGDDAILIKDLTIENANIVAYEDAGILAGRVYYNAGGATVISNVHSSGEIEATGETVIGGLVGYLSSSEIYDSSSSANVYRMEGAVGGLVGYSINSHIEDSFATGNVTGTESVGGLVGYLSSDSCEGGHCTIVNSYATGDVSGTAGVGGLVGYNQGDDITLSYATGNVTGTMYVGGLVGYNTNAMTPGEIYTSYATGSVTGVSRVGGLVGYNNGHIEDTYATGDVTGNGRIGGLVGETDVGDYSTIINSYATGDISGNQYVGGLIGENDLDTVINSYSVGNVLGNSYTGGLIGYFDGDGDPYTDYIYNSGWYQRNPNLDGIGYDTLTSGPVEVDYVETNNENFYSDEYPVYYWEGDDWGWDFTGVWTEQANDYPLLTNNLEVRQQEEEEEELDLGIIRLSVNDEGVEGDENSYKFGGSYDISEDGRYVAFVSNADNLVSDDDNEEGLDVFVYDTEERNIERIAPMVEVEGQEIAFAPCIMNSCYVSISDNGRYVAIGTGENSDSDQGLVFLIDRNDTDNSKVISNIILPLEDFFTTQLESFPFMPYPSLSGDGQYLSVSSPLIGGPSFAVYYNIQTEEMNFLGMPIAFRGSISKDKQTAIFGLIVDLIDEDTNDLMDIYAINDPENIDTKNEESIDLLELISLKPDGEQFTNEDVSMIFAPYISEDGHYATFTTYTQVNGPVGYSTIYLRDREEETTTEIFRSESSLLNYYASSMSNDGRFIVFASSALSIDAPMGKSPIYIYDRETQEVTNLVEGLSHNSVSISGNGEYISFASISNSLVADDTNGESDIFFMQNPFFEGDVCPNIDGSQTEVPRGKYINRQGNCVSRSSGGGGSSSLSTIQATEGGQQNVPAENIPTQNTNQNCLSGYLYDPYTGKLCSSQVGQSNLNVLVSPNGNNQSAPNFNRVLKYGMTGEDVKTLQTYLNTHGYDCGIADGVFGSKTKQAVIKFQLTNNLVGDGVVGPLTQSKMN